LWKTTNCLEAINELLLEELLKFFKNIDLLLLFHTKFCEENWKLVEVWTSIGSQFFLDSVNSVLNLLFIEVKTW
jgi:hypothetical protein